jgi:hypothetical protein
LTIVPIPEKTKQKNDKIIERQSKRFYARLMKSKYPSPSIIKLLLFRMARSSMKVMLNETNRDYAYYLKNGWFEKDYFYPVKLGVIKKWFGQLFDMRVAYVARTKNRVGIF